MTAKEAARSLDWELRAAYDNKERTPLPSRIRGIAPAGYFTADVSVFTGTPPMKPSRLESLEWGLVRPEQERNEAASY
jgi:hypothetical protein